MKVTQIAFSKHVGIQEAESGQLSLALDKHVKNHLGTMHAGAQFCLAETASGAFLQEKFPELVGKVVPVIRSAQIKYKKPATETMLAYPSVGDNAIELFREQINKKGRALIEVRVELKGAAGVVTCVGNFVWFVANIAD